MQCYPHTFLPEQISNLLSSRSKVIPAGLTQLTYSPKEGHHGGVLIANVAVISNRYRNEPTCDVLFRKRPLDVFTKSVANGFSLIVCGLSLPSMRFQTAEVESVCKSS